jgi:hypothetical protein
MELMKKRKLHFVVEEEEDARNEMIAALHWKVMWKERDAKAGKCNRWSIVFET